MEFSGHLSYSVLVKMLIVSPTPIFFLISSVRNRNLHGILENIKQNKAVMEELTKKTDLTTQKNSKMSEALLVITLNVRELKFSN